MATTAELIDGFDRGITGDPDAMVATFAPGAVVWHNYDRKVVDAVENMASVGMLTQIVRDSSRCTAPSSPAASRSRCTTW